MCILLHIHVHIVSGANKRWVKVFKGLRNVLFGGPEVGAIASGYTPAISSQMVPLPQSTCVDFRFNGLV